MTKTIGYFGFGSLVNRTTLQTDYVHAVPTRLLGWKRHWQARQHGGDTNVALLSIHPVQQASIQGLLIVDSHANLPAVDEREAGYDRIEITPADLELMGQGVTYRDLPDQLFVYVGKQAAEGTKKAVLLQSYTDAVMQGFFLEYGIAGVEHFIETTLGFDRTIIADRHAPRYSRAVSLEKPMQTVFDDLLQSAGVQFQN